MMGNCRIFLFLISLVAGIHLSVAQEVVDISNAPKDTNGLERIIPFDQSRIDNYALDRDYDYLHAPDENKTYWQRVQDWFYNRFRRGTSSNGMNLVMKVLAYIFGVIATGLVFYYFFTSRSKVRMKRGDVVVGDVFANPTEVEEEQYLSWMVDAEKRGDYNQAIKFLYLFLIRQLDAKQIVRYRSSLTNRSIRDQIQDQQIKHLFSDVANHFESVWFGKFNIEQEIYQLLKTETLKSDLSR